MVHHMLFLSLLLTLAALQGSYAVEYVVTNNAGTTEGGTIFDNEIGVDYSRQSLASATDFIWGIFQQSTDADRKDVQQISMFVDANVQPGIAAYVSNNEIHVSADHIKDSSASGDDVKREITGVLYHEMTHIWQWNGNGQAPVGLTEGIADFVRLKANYVPSHWVQPGQGSNWDQGYDVTARFLDYLNSLRNDFVAELNKKMKTGYNASYFVDLLGKTVDQLWSEYKAQYGNQS